jgi:hypothetical protein
MSRIDLACASCMFWEPGPSDAGPSDAGLCRRHAPRPVVGGDAPSAVRWPHTTKTDWCGEFSEKGTNRTMATG